MKLPQDVVVLDLASVDGRLLASLTREERRTYDALPLEKRRREWLGGRIAAKWAVQGALGYPFSAIEILPGGRPTPAAHGRALGYLSISHSSAIAGAVFRRGPVGFDLERIEPRDESFEVLVFSEEERRALSETDREQAVTAAWCVKEAVAKFRGTGLNEPFSAFVRPARGLSEGSFSFRGQSYAWALVEDPAAEEPSP